MLLLYIRSYFPYLTLKLWNQVENMMTSLTTSFLKFSLIISFVNKVFHLLNYIYPQFILHLLYQKLRNIHSVHLTDYRFKKSIPSFTNKYADNNGSKSPSVKT